MSDYLNIELDVHTPYDNEEKPEINKQHNHTDYHMLQSDIHYITSNLNTFYDRMYNYYYKGGIRNIMLSIFLNIAILTTTNVFILYTGTFINWNNIITDCKYNTSNCNSLTNYIDYSNKIHPLILIYIILTSSYGLIYLYVNINSLYYYSYIKRFYNNVLEIDTELLNIIKWENILDKIKELHDNKKIMIERFNAGGIDLDQYSIISRMTQYNNIFISLVGSNILFNPSNLSRNILFTTYIETIAKTFIFGKIIDIKNTNDSAINKLNKARSHIFKIFLLDILLLPFILLFMMTYYVLKNSRDINNKEGLITNKRWTNYALWTFKTYNEVESDFNERIFKSNFHMNKYTSCYPSKSMNLILYFMRFFISTFLLFLIILSFIEEKALIDLKLGGFNLLWYLAGLTIITATLNSILKTKDFEETNEEIVENLVKYLYVLPPSNIINNYKLYKTFTKHYKPNIVNMLYEISSIILSPYILYVCYYRNIEDIFDFLNKTTTYKPNIGSIDNYSNLQKELDIYNNNIDLIRKREKGYIAFKTIYPQWSNGVKELDDYLSKVSKYEGDDKFPSMYASELLHSSTILNHVDL